MLNSSSCFTSSCATFSCWIPSFRFVLFCWKAAILTHFGNGVFDRQRQGEWASIGLADMFNAGGAIVLEEVTKASGDVTGDVVMAELLVSFLPEVKQKYFILIDLFTSL